MASSKGSRMCNNDNAPVEPEEVAWSCVRKVTTPCILPVRMDRYWRGAGAQGGCRGGGVGEGGLSQPAFNSCLNLSQWKWVLITVSCNIFSQ